MLSSDQRIPYATMRDRPPLSWPGGKRLALWIVPNIEHYEFLPPVSGKRDPWPRVPHPDIHGYGTRDYGNRVGLWRMLEVFDRHSIRATVSLGIAAFEHFPEVMQACEARNYDYMCHGIYNTRYLWDVPEAEDRALIRDCVDGFRKLTGRSMAGWLSPALSHTLNTPDLVAEAGFSYFCDFVHDEQPWPIRTKSGDLISIPYTVDLNDAVVAREGFEAPDFARMIRDTFDRLYADSMQAPRVMCVAVHGYNMGQPHRLRYLDEALGYMLAHDGVWQATGAEIAQHYRSQHADFIARLQNGEG